MAPTPSIQAVAFDPMTLVITMGGPQSPEVLCMVPTAPDRIRKCTTKESSADIAVSAAWGREALTDSNSPRVTRIWSIT